MYLFVNWTLVLFVTLFLTACGGGDGSSKQESEEPLALATTEDITETQYFRVLSPKSCEQKNKNRFIYQVMHDSYLWAENTPELDYTDNKYDSSEKMLTALKSSNDKFSFIIDAQVAQSFFEEGKNNDFGMGLRVARLNASSYVLVIRYVYPNSPADKAGLTRGSMISKVEQKSITRENIDAIVDILQNQKTVNFTFLKKDNTTFTKKLSKELYSIETMLYQKIFTNDKGKKIGYMVFQDFIQNAIKEIDTTFKGFKEADVDELILDLRYNGGGATNVANHLASLIGGSNVSENIFNQIKFNSRYEKYNYTTYFEELNQNALNLNRVFVITTPYTCSSSELVINALKASANNVEVIQIGDTTCGKPYGYLGSGKFCDKALFAINVESQNGDDVGGYEDGLSPTCQAEDNYFKLFGDKDEDSLSEALNYINTGKCTSKASKQQKINHPSEFQLPSNGFKRIMSAY